jgi:hypothetical protein
MPLAIWHVTNPIVCRKSPPELQTNANTTHNWYVHSTQHTRVPYVIGTTVKDVTKFNKILTSAKLKHAHTCTHTHIYSTCLFLRETLSLELNGGEVVIGQFCFSFVYSVPNTPKMDFLCYSRCVSLWQGGKSDSRGNRLMGWKSKRISESINTRETTDREIEPTFQWHC